MSEENKDKEDVIDRTESENSKEADKFVSIEGGKKKKRKNAVGKNLFFILSLICLAISVFLTSFSLSMMKKTKQANTVIYAPFFSGTWVLTDIQYTEGEYADMTEEERKNAAKETGLTIVLNNDGTATVTSDKDGMDNHYWLETEYGINILSEQDDGNFAKEKAVYQGNGILTITYEDCILTFTKQV